MRSQSNLVREIKILKSRERSFAFGKVELRNGEKARPKANNSGGGFVGWGKWQMANGFCQRG